jgi:CBS domain-containing protein
MTASGMMEAGDDRRCEIHHSRGVDRIPLGVIALGSLGRRDVICVRPEVSVTDVVELMIANRIGCIPVVDERRRPIGIITKHDIVEELATCMRAGRAGTPLPADLAVQTADELMIPIAYSIGEHATIEHAAALMASEDIHHILVVDGDDKLVGVVSSKDVVDWLAHTDTTTH